MNKWNNIALAIAISSACSIASAEISPHSLDVDGTIRAPSCEVSVPAGNTYDYGVMSASIVKPGTATTDLDYQKKTWTISCSAQTYLTFKAIDNQAGSASVSDEEKYGLGLVNGDGKIGYYTLWMNGFTVDGESAYHGRQTTGSAAFNTNFANPARILNTPTLRHGWGYRSGETSAQMRPGSLFTMDVEVRPTLAGAQTMKGPLVESVPMEGSVTFEFYFGL